MGYEATASQAAVVAGVTAAAAAIAIVVAAIGVAVAAAYKLGETVFDTSKKFADFATEIGKLSEETGLAAETVSALRAECEAQGRSFGDITAATGEFRKTIGQAAAGSEDARAKLNRLGIDGKKAIYDVDGAFRQAVSTIARIQNPIDQVRAAYAAFGDEGYKLIPFFRDFGGNVDAVIKKAEELGIVISGKDVDAAKQFNRAYADFQNQLKGLTNLFGREFLPTVTGALRDLGTWLNSNKVTIRDWATSAGNFVSTTINAFREIIKFVQDHPILTRIILGVSTVGVSEAVIQGAKGLYNMFPNGSSTPQNQGPKVYDYTRPQDAPPDLAALEAARAEMEKKLQETAERAKRDWDAAIQSWELYGTQAGKSLSDVFSKLQEQFEQSGNSDQFKAGTKAAIDDYLAQANRAYQELEQLEDEKDQRNKATDNEIAVRNQQQLARRQDYARKATDVEQRANDVIAAAQKKANRDYLRDLQDTYQRQNELGESRLQSEVARRQKDLQEGLITERQYIDLTNQFEADELQKRLKRAQEYLAKVKGDKKAEATAEQEVALIKEEITRQKIKSETELTQVEARRKAILDEIREIEKTNNNPDATKQRQKDAANEQKLQLMRERDALRDAIANQGVNNQLIVQVELLRQIYDMRSRELDAVVRILKAQMELSQSMKISGTQIKADVLDHLAQQKTLNQAIADGINQTYDAVAGKLDEQIDKMFKWAGAFKSLFAEPLKAIAHNNLTKLTRGLLDAFIPGLGTELTKTNNPIARPIVDELEKTNKLLSQLVRSTGQSPAAGMGLGSIGNIIGGLGGLGGGGGFGTIFGGNAGGGIFNFGGGGSLGSNLPTGTIVTLPNGEQAYNVNGNQGGGSILGRLKGIFSGKEGGLFAPRQGSKLAGYLGGAGDLAAMVGGMIGGRAGGIMSSVGSFMSIGATIGGPWGAAIGAGVGLIVGLFQGDPKRKEDKQQNIPALNKGFVDSIAQLNQILSDLRQLKIDPDTAISQASEVRAQIAGGFGIQFKSKKYTKQAQQMIAGKLGEADRIIDQIKSAAEIARGAADRRQRILPEFAGGTYFADYFRPNGLMPGVFDGKDNILAMISRGEMVLNPRQQNQVRALAGFDVFSGAGIPNYPNASTSPKLATGGIAGAGLQLAAQPVIVRPNFTVQVHGVAVTDQVATYIESDEGLRQQETVLKKNFGVKRK